MSFTKASLEDQRTHQPIIKYQFHRNNCILYKLFSTKCVSQLLKSLYNTWIILFIGIMISTSFILDLFYRNSFMNIYYTLAMFTSLIIYLSIILLSLNIKCMRLILTSFTFWLKTGYMISFVFTSWISAYYVNPYDNDTYDSKTFMFKIISLLRGIAYILTIVLFSSFDGMNLKTMYKFLGGIVMSSCFTFLSIYYVFINNKFTENDKHSIVHLLGAEISLISFQSSACRILAIFLWRQTFLCYVRRNRCTVVTYAPFVQWIDDHEDYNGVKSIKSHQPLSQKPVSVLNDDTVVEKTYVIAINK